jgi:pyruvate/2-oxoacid:ferredoxin oxidoreductase alpha subunit
MGSINYANPQTDTTVRIFDQFYNYAVDVPVDAYDAVNSYFRSIFGTAEAAGNFTVTLFRIAEQSNIPVLTLLNQIAGLSGPQLTATLAYYLNGVRSNSTLLGINVTTQPNYYVAHNIRS